MAMRYTHSFTASIDFSDYETAKAQLSQANAFEEPDSVNRLRILSRSESPVATAGTHDQRSVHQST
jgi:hypothetical protein